MKERYRVVKQYGKFYPEKRLFLKWKNIVSGFGFGSLDEAKVKIKEDMDDLESKKPNVVWDSEKDPLFDKPERRCKPPLTP